MPIDPLNGFPTAGLAGKYAETINPGNVAFLAGDTPALFATAETVVSGQDLAALTVVGFDGNGKITEADNSAVTAVGVLVYAVDASGGDVVGHVYRGGNFNPDELVWNAGYATDADKAKAFEGAPSPTQIVVSKTETFTAT
jgi:hypothetical protein